MYQTNTQRKINKREYVRRKNCRFKGVIKVIIIRIKSDVIQVSVEKSV